MTELARNDLKGVALPTNMIGRAMRAIGVSEASQKCESVSVSIIVYPFVVVLFVSKLSLVTVRPAPKRS